MQNTNQESVANSNFDWNIAASGARPAWEFHRFCDLHYLPNNGHFTLATLPFCNLTSILKLETLCFRIKDWIEK